MPRKKIAISTKRKRKSPARKTGSKVPARKKKNAVKPKKIAARKTKPAPKAKKRKKIVARRAVKRRATAPRRISPRHRPRPLPLKKFHKNPIVEPHEDHDWECQYTFNPAAVHLDGRVHLVYRAIGNSGISVLGYASTKDGVNIDERLDEPIYVPRQPFEYDGTTPPDPNHVGSGGGFGGCEDPRITEIDGRCYMTYTAFNGYPRMAITSIKTEDFLKKNKKWLPAVLISEPGQVHKNWVIFPEKIGGKYAILHGITPTVMIEYRDSLVFDGKTFIKSNRPSNDRVTMRPGVWDSYLRGVGPSPLKTKDGWLIIYHAIDDRDPGRYKFGAMLLDYKNPEKILYRSAGPIMAPDARYENEGFKSGVIYTCGAVIKNGTLYVYYGGADTVTCVATANLDQFLTELKSGTAHVNKIGPLKKKRNARR